MFFQWIERLSNIEYLLQTVKMERMKIIPNKLQFNV